LIVYQRDGRIRIAGADGTGDRVLTSQAPGDQEHPDWSPDGRRIAFETDFRTLWVVGLSGARPTRIYDCAAPCQFVQEPAWSPDGSRLAFTRAFATSNGAATARSEIAVIDLATRAIRPVYTSTRTTDIPFTARWSPDGRRLVFELDRFVDARATTVEITGSRIGTIRANAGGTVSRLTSFDALAQHPDWSPDSRLIVYHAGTRGIVEHPADPANLFAIRPDGTGRRQITHYRAPEERAVQPTWAPQGRRIVFTYVRGGGFGAPVAATISADGSDLEAPARSAPPQTHPRQQPKPDRP
jgi:Tol biopolymer transport system component